MFPQFLKFVGTIDSTTSPKGLYVQQSASGEAMTTNPPPLISVVLTIYNEEKFLRPCLDSLLAQSLENIEIICVDDGSTDTSPEILQEYEEKDQRIQILTQKNRGAGAARNRGMKEASGSYLSFLDSDDFFEADMLEKLWQAAEQHQSDITICRVNQYDSARGIYRENKWSIMPWMLPQNPFSPDDIPEKIFNIGCGWAWDKLFRRDFVVRSGITFQEQRTTNDMLFVYSLYTKARKIYVVDQVLAHQRINIKTSLSVTRERSFDNFYQALSALKERLERDNCYEKYRRSFVNWALNFSLWNIDTLELETGRILREKCRKEYFPVLDIPDHPEDYYYSKTEYERMKAIMEGNVKISVIIPVYNAEHYLKQCLDSLFAQTFQDFEALAVDDGSVDASPSILQEYAEREPRLHVFTKEHSNAGEARNLGLEQAAGEYLAFLDADDFVEPQFLERAYSEAVEKEADIVMFRCNQYDEPSKTFRECPWTLRTWEMPEQRPFSAQDTAGKIFNMGSCTPWDKLFKRSFIVENNIHFQSNESSNDMLFTYAAQALAGRISTIEDILCHQRVGYPKCLAKDIEYLTSCFYKALKALQSFLIERGIDETFKKSFVNWAVDFSLFSLHNFHDVFRELIRQQLKREWFKSLDISETPEEDFYVREQYEEMRALVAEREEELRQIAENPSERPKVSIIIPIYNVSQYLRLCLDSAINQTLEEIEIIAVNDGSTDNCLDILNEYAAKDPRIVVITGPNGGYGRAMNQGLDRATGEYIGIIEPDDFVDVKMYKNLYDIAVKNNLDFIKSDFYRFVHDDLGYLFLDRNKASKVESDYNVILNPQIYNNVFKYVMNTWCGIYSRKLIHDNKIRHNETPGASFQDNGFWFETMTSATRVYFSPIPYYYNKRDNPNSSVKSKEKVYAMNTEYDYIYSYLDKDKSKFDKFIGIFHLKRYNNYIYTYERIADEFKNDYIKSISEEFKKSYEMGEIDESLFSQYELEELKWIINNPEDYYNKHNDLNPIKVSVIIPVYNVEEFLSQTLDSILNQTLKDIEIICVDDGSEDRSMQILREYEQRDPRIIVIEQEHMGGGAARNKGMSRAKGEFLSFLDSDDFFENTLLEHTYNKCRKTGSDICIYKVKRYDNNTGKTISDKGSFVESNIPDKQVFSSTDMKDKIFNTFQTWPWNKLFRRSFIEKHNIKFQEILRTNDMYFVNTALMKAERICVIREELVNYREGTQRNCQSTNNKAPTDFFKALYALHENVFEDQSYEEKISFNNLFVRSCNYNLKTLSNTDPQAFAELYNYLHNDGFEKINPELININEISDDNKKAYKECMNIEKFTFEEYMFDKLNYNRNLVSKLNDKITKLESEIRKKESEIRKKESEIKKKEIVEEYLLNKLNYNSGLVSIVEKYMSDKLK